MTQIADRLAALQDPAYTGENRCVPCTVVNGAIAAGLAVSIAVALTLLRSPLAGALAGQAVLLLAILPIYFRGYLVPGTPTITKRYFPPWLLAKFDKSPADGLGDGGVASDTAAADGAVEAADQPDEAEIERRLVEAAVLEPCEGTDDLCLTDGVASEWERHLKDLGADPERTQLLDLLEVDAEDVTVQEFEDAFRVRVDGRLAGRWESEAAFRADLASGAVLSDRLPDWGDLPVDTRGSLLNGVRLFVEQCPTCGGPVTMGTNTVESCCREVEVAALSCEDCGARLFESEPL